MTMTETRDARRQRKREEARGIEEFRESLGTPAPLTPQAVFHWNRDDQVNALVAARFDDPDVGFMARLLALCSLPRTDPGNRDRYVRRNGPFTLIMIAGGEIPKLPYGTLPRLLLAWVCTEAVRTGRRELVLGRSLAEFMRQIGITNDSGGRRGDRTRLQNQMRRLFAAQVSLNYADKRHEVRVSSLVADRAEFWWDAKRPEEPVMWNSTIRLGENFFNEIVTKPIPLDMNTMRSLKRSPLGLDLYLWLTYRTFGLKAPMWLSWPQIYRQFGVDPSNASDKVTVQAFRRKVLRELIKIKLVWPELCYRTVRGGLIVSPSSPRIADAPTPHRPQPLSRP